MTQTGKYAGLDRNGVEIKPGQIVRWHATAFAEQEAVGRVERVSSEGSVSTVWANTTWGCKGAQCAVVTDVVECAKLELAEIEEVMQSTKNDLARAKSRLRLHFAEQSHRLVRFRLALEALKS